MTADVGYRNDVVGPVELRLPPDASMSRVLRLAASGVASLGGFSIDEIEDIKLAVSEVLIALVEHGSSQPVDIRFLTQQDSFTIVASSAVRGFDLEHRDLRLCRVVLASVCSHHTIDVAGGIATITAVVPRATHEG